MDVKEKLHILEDAMDLEEGTLSEEDVLSSYEEWDSLASLSLMAMLDRQMHKKITPDEIKNLKLVADALKLME